MVIFTNETGTARLTTDGTTIITETQTPGGGFVETCDAAIVTDTYRGAVQYLLGIIGQWNGVNVADNPITEELTVQTAALSGVSVG